MLCAGTVEARPSFRSIREGVERNTYDKDDPTQAGWRKKYFEPQDWGLRVTYPSSWQPPHYEPEGVSSDGKAPYSYALLKPHDAGFGKRKNYILELYALRWDVGQEMTIEEVEAFAYNETKPRFREYWFEEEFATEVAGLPAWTRIFTTMTGYREETWFSDGRYLYTLGFRSLYDFIEGNHFFFEEMVASTVVTPVPELERGDTSPHSEKDAKESDDAEETPVIDPATAIFKDVDESHPYAEAIAWAKDTGTVGGYPDGTFQPDRTVNRVEFLKIVLENIGIDKSFTSAGFPDLATGAWYLPYVANGKALLVVDGYPDGTFKPERTVVVAEALKMAYKALGIRTASGDSDPWYAKYYGHASANSIMYEALSPGAEMKRKDVVWIVWKLLNQ